MFSACGVPEDKFRTICSAVDKLDKVRNVLIDIYGNLNESWIFLFYLLGTARVHIINE